MLQQNVPIVPPIPGSDKSFRQNQTKSNQNQNRTNDPYPTVYPHPAPPCPSLSKRTRVKSKIQNRKRSMRVFLFSPFSPFSPFYLQPHHLRHSSIPHSSNNAHVCNKNAQTRKTRNAPVYYSTGTSIKDFSRQLRDVYLLTYRTSVLLHLVVNQERPKSIKPNSRSQPKRGRHYLRCISITLLSYTIIEPPRPCVCVQARMSA